MAGAQTRRSHGGRADRIDRGAGDADDARRRRDRDEPIERAYKAGYSGGDRAEHETSDELAQHYDDGAQARKDEDRAAARQARADQVKGKGLDVAQNGAGFILGLFAYALLVNYLAGGVKGSRAWLAAKFLNRTSTEAAKPRSPIKPSAPSGAGE